MKGHELTAYHCCFLLERQSTTLSMAIAWRRIGSVDYGVYLTRRGQELDASPNCTLFKSLSGSDGRMSSFLVADGWLREGDCWHEDHMDQASELPLFSPVDAESFSVLGDAFFGEWLETFGQAEAVSLLKGMGLSGAAVSSTPETLLGSGLPAVIQSRRLMEVLRCVEPTEHGHLYCFMPRPERPGERDAAGAVLEAKMRMFFELL